MSGHTTMFFAASGAAIAATTGGPLAEVLNELALMTAIMGALGGVTRGLSIRGLSPMEVVRGVLLGSLLAFGFGAVSPTILDKMFGLSISAGGQTVPILAASSYLVGLLQDVLLAKFQRVEK